jgi:two-component system chemotaxis response regulator CheV
MTASTPTTHTTPRNASDARGSASGGNQFELLLFRLGQAAGSERRELFGINIFKVREIMVMPALTKMVTAPAHVLGVANIRGQIIPVIDLPALAGCTPKQGDGILLVTEFARTTQGFAVEEVTEIVRVDWRHVLSAEGRGGELVTSIARIDGDAEDSRLAQVIDVERILQDVMPDQARFERTAGGRLELPPGTVVLAADDSAMARGIIEKGLQELGVPCIMTRSGKEAWERLQQLAAQARAEGKTAKDKVALLLTDLEMPEMDGFTLTRQVKADVQYGGIPVVVHSSLTGAASELQAQSAGADAYIAKFHIDELAATLRGVLARR